MKQAKQVNQPLSLDVREMSANPMAAASVMTFESVTDLEYVMTNSAFGYEYAVQALEVEGEYGLMAEKLRLDIDVHKQTYFIARDKLHGLDLKQLERVENDLRLQKMVVFQDAGQYLN
jgi:hypothetical protein